jgi:cytochrome P450
MLRDPLFNQDENSILNESLTFFFAGSLTQATLLSNTLSYLIKDKKINQRARDSLSINFKSFADKNATLYDLARELSIENFD